MDTGLFTEFPPVSSEAWEAQINADLKGKDYEKTLIWQTSEGIKVRPYYRAENLKEAGFTNILPGEFPFIRGKEAVKKEWLVRQDIEVNDLHEANLKAVDVLSKGVNSIGFVFKESKEISSGDFQILLQGIDAEKVEINLVMPGRKEMLIKNFLDWIKKRNFFYIRASINFDPIGAYMMTGKLAVPVEAAVSAMKETIGSASAFPGIHVISINGFYFNNAGSSIVQELGFSLAIGAEYLNILTDSGVSIDSAAPKMRLNFGVGGNYFMEIAKIRAARLLWANIVKAYAPENIESCKAFIHAETSLWNKTIYDPYVNMLRTQTEAMSAVLGGADSLTVFPFDIMYEQPTEFAERIARNQQALLKDEAHFDKITDPAGGSYYIETLTASIADQAWKIFLEVQEKGGFIAALKEGFIQGQLKEMAEKKAKAISSRRENILGVNQFANVTEQISAELNVSVFEMEDKKVPEAEIETIKMFRGASQFESLRYSTDQFCNLNPRPKVFLLTIGDLSMRKARAQFSANFFAVAGYSIIDNNGFASVAEGVKAAMEASADIVVICSSDDEYASYAPEAYKLLNNQAIFVVAGAPGSMEELKASGIENFINIKTNLLESLTEFNSKLGIKKAL